MVQNSRGINRTSNLMQGPSTSTSSLNWKRPPVRPFQPRTNTYQPVRAGGRPAAAYSRRGRATMPAATAARRPPPPATAAAAGASTAPDADISAPSSAARPPHIVGNTALPEKSKQYSYEDISRAIKCTAKTQYTIVMGDFNAKVGVQECKELRLERRRLMKQALRPTLHQIEVGMATPASKENNRADSNRC
ncbi:unnamed protein product [Plutella xylostella]|uniref:(diamondback moth) hypothetical protein n=1 Tax=Plutella xylostella TaxID=51655 RepID=A0A8S4GG79_PLUXY|nr:unnamed protein product [Plutella xylostella]